MNLVFEEHQQQECDSVNIWSTRKKVLFVALIFLWIYNSIISVNGSETKPAMRHKKWFSVHFQKFVERNKVDSNWPMGQKWCYWHTLKSELKFNWKWLFWERKKFICVSSFGVLFSFTGSTLRLAIRRYKKSKLKN